MGYDIHITRKANWFDEEGDQITSAEWMAYIRSDPEMRLDGYAQANLRDGSVLRVDDPTMAVWIAHPEHDEHDGMAWLRLSRGAVVAKNPDEATLRKMWCIAEALGAQVQGDDGELYDPAGHVLSREPTAPSPASPRKPWWRLWRR